MVLNPQLSWAKDLHARTVAAVAANAASTSIGVAAPTAGLIATNSTGNPKPRYVTT
jgi:hypothetical protein